MTRRHTGLVALTHDHHHALGHARRLRLAANGDSQGLLRQAQRFLAFFHEETLNHFREEEEVVFPLAVQDERATQLLGQVMMEHLKIHALASQLSAQVSRGSITSEVATALAAALEAHIRFEEGKLFPLIEEVVGDEQLSGLSLPRDRIPVPG